MRTKIAILTMLVGLSLSACAGRYSSNISSPGPYGVATASTSGAGIGIFPQQHGGGRAISPQGYYVYGGGQGGVYTQPCEPFHAEGLMGWAKNLGQNTQHNRSANVSNNQGQVYCSSNENASSSTGSLYNSYPTYPTYPSYRRY